MSDVVAVALLTALATLSGSIGVTYLAHRLEARRSRWAARRDQLSAAREPLATMVSAGRAYFEALRAIWVMATNAPNLSRASFLAAEFGDGADAHAERRRFDHALADIETLIDDAEVRTLLDRLAEERETLAAAHDAVFAFEVGERDEAIELATARAVACVGTVQQIHRRIAVLIQTID